MLLPNEWAVLTIEEAKSLVAYIDKTTATKGQSTRNYDKIHKAGMGGIYARLNEFVSQHAHYDDQLRNLDTSDFARDDR